MAASRSSKSVAIPLCVAVCALALMHSAETFGQDPSPDLPGEPPLPFMAKWGTNGTATGEFSFPKDVAIDAAGNVYVADTGNNRIQKFDNNGTFLGAWGSSGSGEGEFWGPVGLAIDASGKIYVSDSNRYRVQIFDSAGNFLEMWGWGVATGASAFEICTSGCQTGLVGGGDGQFNYPGDIAFDLAGNVYVADSGNHRIQKFDSSGNFLGTWGWGVATGASALEVCTGGCQAGLLGNSDGQLAYPDGVAVDNWGTVYVADTLNHRVQKFDTSGAYLGKMADPGSLGYVLISTPYRVVVDSAGNLYIGDYGNNRIWKYDVNGTFLTNWGTTGSGDGQFDKPVGLAIDASGNLYTTEIGNHRVQKFGPSFDTLVFITRWASFGTGDGQFDEPWGVAVDASGNVYVADTNNNRIQLFDKNGEFLESWGSLGSGDGQLNYPTDVAVDATGNVYVSDTFNNRISKFNKHGQFVGKWGSAGITDGLFAMPTGVAVDDLGNVYVGDRGNHRVQKFDSNGTFLGKWGTNGSGDGQFSNPHALGVDASGNVYVSDTFNNRMQKFDSSGTFILKWGTTGTGDGQFTNPAGVAFDASGNVYVADWGNARVQKFDSSGNFINKWGLSGTGDAEFGSPGGVAVDPSGNVYVSDYGNHNVQKFGPCSFSPTPGSRFFTSAAGSGSFDVDALVASCGWTATSSFSWITVTSGTEGTHWGLGDGSIDFSVGANPTALWRGGYIHLSDETTGGPGVSLAVVQDPGSCAYALSATSASFSAAAGAGFVSVTGPPGCGWTAVSNDAWISVTGGGSGSGSGAVNYSVAASSAKLPRTGTITIAGRTFTVNQEGVAPTAPAGVTAAIGGPARIDVGWTDNSDDEDRFRVYRSVNAGAWVKVATLPANTTSFVDTSVSSPNEYCYRARSQNGMGYSAYSNVGCAEMTPPDAPTALQVTPSGGQIDAIWNDNSGNESRFRVYRSVNGGPYARVATVAANATSWSDTTINATDSYCYRARAQNDLGYSGYSNVDCAGSSKPDRPTNVQVAAPSLNQVDVTWTDNSDNETRFRIYRTVNAGPWIRVANAPANATVYTDNTVSGGNDYCYRARAQNAAGYSTYSNVACVDPASPDLSTAVVPDGFVAQEPGYTMSIAGPPPDKMAAEGGGTAGAGAAAGETVTDQAINAPDGTASEPSVDDRQVVRLYKNTNAWWNENRDEATLAALGKVPGYDVFVHRMSDLWLGIPDDTDVVYLASATGDAGLAQIEQQTFPLAQASLETFVRRGGTLIAGLADNQDSSGYLVPGARGTPDYLLPSDCQALLFGGAAFGADGAAGTADDHALMLGNDRTTGTEDDLTDESVSLVAGCYAAHGNLEDGIGLPAGAQALMYADFGGSLAPVLAEYTRGAGRVIVTTVTLEFAGHDPVGQGASRLLTNLFGYALEDLLGGEPPLDGPEGEGAEDSGESSGKRPPGVVRRRPGGLPDERPSAEIPGE